MSSFIHYKFKSAKDFDTYRFEGAGIPVWELKQEIIQAKKLGKGMDFDLVILNAQTNEEYRSDSFIVPKNTSVLVKRVPGVKVRQYVFDHSQSADRRAEVLQPVQAATTTSFAEYFPTRQASFSAPKTVATSPDGSSPGVEEAPNDEEGQIAAMMDAHSAAWSQNQQQIGVGQDSFRPRSYRPAFRPPPQMSAPPPPYYVCFRCGQKGHYIANCPTNADPNFDKPRLKKSTGIPRAFLKTVAGDASGGVLVTPDGSLVVAVSNDQEWQKISSATTRGIINPESVPEHLRCKICRLLLNEPSCCPACKQPFCDECIMKTGPAKDLSCPNCHASFMAEQLLPADALKRDLEAFISSQQRAVSTPQVPEVPASGFMPGFRPPMPAGMFPFPPLPFPFPPIVPPPPPPQTSKPERSPLRKRNRSRSASRSRSPSGSSKRPHLK